MILPTFTDIEIKNELEKDKEEVIHKMHEIINSNAWRRVVIKSRRYPVRGCRQFTSSRKNKYILSLVATDKKISLKNPLTRPILTFNKSEGLYAATHDMITDSVTIWTPHFFSRYRTRFLKDDTLSPYEVIFKFFERNQYLYANRSWDAIRPQNDEDVMSAACDDGYVVVKNVKNGIYVAKTFVTREMLHDEQRAKYLELKEHLDPVKFEEFDNFRMNLFHSRRLQMKA